MEDAYTRSLQPAAEGTADGSSATPIARPNRDAPPSPIEEAVLRLTRLTLGAAGLSLALASALIRSPQQTPEEPTADEQPPGGAELAARAGFGLAMEVQRRAIETIVGAGTTLARASSLAAGMAPLSWWRDRLRSTLSAWGDRGAKEQAESQTFAAEVISSLLRRTTAAVLDTIDLDQLAARIDVEALVDRVDLDRIIDRVDVEAIVRRVDLNAVADRIDVDRIISRVDLNELVARVDVDRIMEGIDVEAIVRRLDLAGIARDVMDELQVDEIIRESAGSLAVETVDAVRVQGVSADTFVSHFVDRLLRRKNGRELGVGIPVDGDGGRTDRDG